MKNILVFTLVALILTSFAAKAENMTDLPLDEVTSHMTSSENKKSSTSSDNGYQAVDNDEGKMIVEAINDAISDYSKVTCVTSSSDSHYASTSLEYGISAVKEDMNNFVVVYRKLGSQPVLKLKIKQSPDFVFVTTDSSGRRINQIEIRNITEKPAVLINVGTIAQPHYIKKSPAPLIFSKKCVLVK